jgi:hypothetical protein
MNLNIKKKSYRFNGLFLFFFIFGLSLNGSVAEAVEVKQYIFTDTQGEPYYFTHGGTEEAARAAVTKRCQNYSPLLKNVRMFADEFNLWGRMRSWTCSFTNIEDRKRPTSIEQKALQTRRINKPYKEVADGLDQWVKNSGFSQLLPFGKFGNGVAIIDADKNRLHIQVEFSKPNPDSTLVRIRTFEGFYIDPKKEVFSTSLYQSLFTMMAQELFTEAINLEPAELN